MPWCEWLFAHKVERNGCWLWPGRLTKTGYVRFHGQTGAPLGHRIAWEYVHGPVPEGKRILHRCDVRNCINPAHLFLGTQADNVRDMYAKGRNNNRGRHNPVRGERSPFAKLTEQDVRDIRRLASMGRVHYARVARGYGVAPPTIRNVVLGVQWAHVR